MVVNNHVGAEMRTLTVLSFKVLICLLPTVNIRQADSMSGSLLKRSLLAC